jgi:hypothetical protein
MATERYYRCGPCGGIDRACEPLLFDTLLNFSELKRAPACNVCGREQELHVVMNFGLGAGPQRFRVLHVFLPGQLESWPHPEDERPVTFYPFFAILRPSDREARPSFWLPYWHVHGATKKYGQWAPFVDDPQFSDLVGKARQNRYCL